MNMMRKNNNRNNHNRNNRGGGGRRYNNNGGGGNRNQNDGQNLARQKHHATQMLGKYSDLLRNAQNNGDRVDVEYYLQHIDHYNRVLADIGAIEAERYAAREAHMPAQHDAQAAGGEGDVVEANGESAAAPATEEAVQSSQPRPARQPRRNYQQQPPQQQAAEQAAPANESSGDVIPLPGNILPPI